MNDAPDPAPGVAHVLLQSAASPALDLGPALPGAPAGGGPLVIIAAQPRSGSHMLGQVLLADGRFGCPLEYFHARHWAAWQERLAAGGGSVGAAEVLAAIRAARSAPATGITTIKAHWPQFAAMQDSAIAPDLAAARYVYLRRQDMLGQAISLEIADQTQAWVSGMARAGRPVYQRAAITARLEQIAAQQQAWEAFFDSKAIVRLDLTYEDLLADLGGAVARIAGFLGLTGPSPAPARTLTERQADATNAAWRALYAAGAEDETAA